MSSRPSPVRSPTARFQLPDAVTVVGVNPDISFWKIRMAPSSPVVMTSGRESPFMSATAT
jgi:hypothetical protein